MADFILKKNELAKFKSTLEFVDKGSLASVYKLNEEAIKIFNTSTLANAIFIADFKRKALNLKVSQNYQNFILPQDAIYQKTLISKKLIGYTMKYINALSIAKSTNSISLDSYITALNKLQKQLEEFGKEEILINDIHLGNILFKQDKDNNFYFIDSDSWSKSSYDRKKILTRNEKNICDILGQNFLIFSDLDKLIQKNPSLCNNLNNTYESSFNYLIELYSIINEKLKQEYDIKNIGDLKRILK